MKGHLKRTLVAAGCALAAVSTQVYAGHHQWFISEIYSNAAEIQAMRTQGRFWIALPIRDDYSSDIRKDKFARGAVGGTRAEIPATKQP